MKDWNIMENRRNSLRLVNNSHENAKILVQNPI